MVIKSKIVIKNISLPSFLSVYSVTQVSVGPLWLRPRSLSVHSGSDTGLCRSTLALTQITVGSLCDPGLCRSTLFVTQVSVGPLWLWHWSLSVHSGSDPDHCRFTLRPRSLSVYSVRDPGLCWSTLALIQVSVDPLLKLKELSEGESKVSNTFYWSHASLQTRYQATGAVRDVERYPLLLVASW